MMPMAATFWISGKRKKRPAPVPIVRGHIRHPGRLCAPPPGARSDRKTEAAELSPTASERVCLQRVVSVDADDESPRKLEIRCGECRPYQRRKVRRIVEIVAGAWRSFEFDQQSMCVLVFSRGATGDGGRSEALHERLTTGPTRVRSGSSVALSVVLEGGEADCTFTLYRCTGRDEAPWEKKLTWKATAKDRATVKLGTSRRS